MQSEDIGKVPFDYSDLVRTLEFENQRLMMSQKILVTEANRKCEVYAERLETIRRENEEFKKKVEELKRLCYFLDDDRHRAKMVCQELRDFGWYAGSAMKKELNEYREKITELEKQKFELLSENCNLKKVTPNKGDGPSGRDFGDGSSDTESARLSNVLPLEEKIIRFNANRFEQTVQKLDEKRNLGECDLLDYVRRLEIRVQQLEQDRLTASVSAPNLTAFHSPPSVRQESKGSSSPRSSLCDEICIISSSMEAPQEGASRDLLMEEEVSDDDDSVLSPIVEENENDRSCGSSVEESFEVTVGCNTFRILSHLTADTNIRTINFNWTPHAIGLETYGNIIHDLCP